MAGVAQRIREDYNKTTNSAEIRLWAMGEEKVFGKEQWKLEVAAVIHDIRSHVRSVSISSLDGTDDLIYFNLTTLEGDDFCIQMSKNGFLICDTCYDSSKDQSDDYFETPYALLDKISPKYRESFANKLISSLNVLRSEFETGTK